MAGQRMAKTSGSPRSTLRRSIPDAYRARGHRVNNLWLVYSVKTDRDWLLPSDRQLVHWLSFLEVDPEVIAFDLAPEPVVSRDEKGPRATELDAIVVFRDQHVEWHEVKAGNVCQEADRSQLLAQAAAAHEAGVIYRVFNDNDFRPNARLAVRWLKAIGFAAAIRGQEHGSCRTAVVSRLNSLESGHVRAIVSDLEGFDPAIVYGTLIRLAISGVVHLDLAERSFGLATRWKLCGR